MGIRTVEVQSIRSAPPFFNRGAISGPWGGEVAALARGTHLVNAVASCPVVGGRRGRGTSRKAGTPLLHLKKSLADQHVAYRELNQRRREARPAIVPGGHRLPGRGRKPALADRSAAPNGLGPPWLSFKLSRCFKDDVILYFDVDWSVSVTQRLVTREKWISNQGERRVATFRRLFVGWRGGLSS